MPNEESKERKRLSSARKKEIDDYTDMVLAMFPQKDKGFDWQELCLHEGIAVKHDTFAEKFDALIVYEKVKKKFTIIVNDRNLRGMPAYRINFTICHELGHYFLPEHRYMLERKGMMAQVVQSARNGRTVEEREADYFASHLLMPTAQIAQDFAQQRFSPAFIQEVANRYKVSRDACLMRYIEIGPGAMMLVYSENGKTQPNYFHKKSGKFPFARPLDMGEGRLPDRCLASVKNNLNLLPDSNLNPQVSNYKQHQTSDVFGRLIRNVSPIIYEFCVPTHEEGKFLSVFYF